MNDAAIVRRLKQLDACRQKIQDIIDEIAESDHPQGRAIAEALYEQCWFPAWPEHVAADYLDSRRWGFRQLGNGVPGGLISRREANRRHIALLEIIR